MKLIIGVATCKGTFFSLLVDISSGVVFSGWARKGSFNIILNKKWLLVTDVKFCVIIV
jgi:hypothetical protein